MVTVDTYIKNTIKLVKSFTVKSNDLAVHINNELIDIYGTSILGLDPSDKSTWKYYMNICGLYHTIDKPIKITVIETGIVKELTKELMLLYPTTCKELLKFDTYYTDLIDNYPTDELLIKGIIYDLDMDFVINADEGYILSYSDHYIEIQESNLIREISNYSINFFKRWNIREYGIIDNLFIASLLGTLYTKLILKILNVRYANIYTSNTHSFHMYEFFRSHFDVDVSVLNTSTKFWLYKNMRYIRKNIGSNETLNIIIEKILTNNGIGIAEVELINSLPDVTLLQKDDVTKSLYDIKTNTFISKERNNYYLNSDTDNLSSYNMLLLQFNSKLVENDLVIKQTSDIDNKYLPILDKNILHRQKTKTFKLKINKDTIVTQEVNMKLLMDNWTYLAYSDKLRSVESYIDPNTGIVYTLTPKQGILMVFKMIANINGIKNPILKGYVANNVINENITKELLKKNLLRVDAMDDIIDKIYDYMPKTETYISDNTFDIYIKNLITYKSMIWNIASNTNDMLFTSNIKLAYRRLHKNVYIDFGEDKTIDDLISEQSMFLTIEDDYDYMLVLKDLFELFTGFKIGDDDIMTTLDSYIDITKKLSSYTIQFLSNKNDLDVLPLRFNGTRSLHLGIVDIRDSTFRALESFYGFISATTVPYDNFIKTDNLGITLINKVLDRLTIVGYDLNVMYANYNPNITGNVRSGLVIFKPEIDATTYDNNRSDIIEYRYNLQVSGFSQEKISLNMSDNLELPTLINVSYAGLDVYKPDITVATKKFNNIFEYDEDLTVKGNVDRSKLTLLMSDETKVPSLYNIGYSPIEIYKPNLNFNSGNIDTTSIASKANDLDLKLVSNEPEIIASNYNNDNNYTPVISIRNKKDT